MVILWGLNQVLGDFMVLMQIILVTIILVINTHLPPAIPDLHHVLLVHGAR